MSTLYMKYLIDKKIQETIKTLSYSESLKNSNFPVIIEDGFALEAVAKKDLIILDSLEHKPQQLINATPHPIVIMREDQSVITTIQPSGILPRLVAMCQESSNEYENFCFAEKEDLRFFEIPVTRKNGILKTDGLPAYEENIFYIVSFAIFQAHPERIDLLSVDPVRDSNNFTIGAKGFIRHI